MLHSDFPPFFNYMDFGLVDELNERDKKHLTRLHTGVIVKDADSLVDELIRMNAVSAGVDQPGLGRDLDRLLNHSSGLPLKDIHIQEILEEFTSFSSRHHLPIPANLWLLVKTLVMMEGSGLRLKPGFDIFAVSEPYVRELKQEMWTPKAERG